MIEQKTQTQERSSVIYKYKNIENEARSIELQNQKSPYFKKSEEEDEDTRLQTTTNTFIQRPSNF
jgi:hypothetical protein